LLDSRQKKTFAVELLRSFKAAPFRGNVTKVRASAISALALQSDTDGAGFPQAVGLSPLVWGTGRWPEYLEAAAPTQLTPTFGCR
jgi:hypothetical protein